MRIKFIQAENTYMGTMLIDSPNRWYGRVNKIDVCRIQYLKQSFKPYRATIWGLTIECDTLEEAKRECNKSFHAFIDKLGLIAKVDVRTNTRNKKITK